MGTGLHSTDQRCFGGNPKIFAFLLGLCEGLVLWKEHKLKTLRGGRRVLKQISTATMGGNHAPTGLTVLGLRNLRPHVGPPIGRSKKMDM